MSDDVTQAVRKACAEVWTGVGIKYKCRYPNQCKCFNAPDVLAALIANAKAEGREAAVRACSAIGAKYNEKKPALSAVAWECCAAIRNREADDAR